MWETAVITDAGAALNRQWLQGGALTLDGAWAGSGVTENVYDATDLAHREAQLTLTAWKPSESGVTCALEFPPAERGYVCNQIGLFGHLDEGEPVLIALYQDARGMEIPAAAELPEFHYTFFAPVAIGNHGELTVKVAHGLYPSWEEFQEAVAGISAEEIGAVPTSRKVNGKALETDITLTAQDVKARPDTWTPTAGEVGARPDTWTPTAGEVGAVPTSRKINNKPLTGDVTLTAPDVSAVPVTRRVNGKPLTGDITLTTTDLNAVPAARSINGRPLTGDISLTAEDVGARPNTWTPSAEDIGARPDDWTPTAEDVGAVPTSRKINGKPLSTDVTLTASDVKARPNTWTPSAADVGAVPTGRKINGKPLSTDITLSASDVSARPFTWTPTAAEVGAVPTSRKINGQPLTDDIMISGVSGNAATATKLAAPRNINGVPFDGSQDITIADNTKVPTSRKVNNKALTGDISLTAADVGAMPYTRNNTGGGVDFNTVTANGFYTFQGESANPLKNTPVGNPTSSHYHLLVWNIDEATAKYVRQVAYDVRNTTQYTRVMTNGTWGAWEQMYTTGNKPSAADVGARPSTWTPTAADTGAVPTGRKVNNKALTGDISLTAADVGARPSTWTPTAADTGAVPTGRKVNNKPLSADISLAAADVGAVPTSRKINGQALTGDITLAIPAISSGTDDLTAGESPLANGAIYLVYE